MRILRVIKAYLFGSTCALCRKPFLMEDCGYVSKGVGSDYITCKACEEKNADVNEHWRKETQKHYANLMKEFFKD